MRNYFKIEWIYVLNVCGFREHTIANMKLFSRLSLYTFEYRKLFLAKYMICLVNGWEWGRFLGNVQIYYIIMKAQIYSNNIPCSQKFVAYIGWDENKDTLGFSAYVYVMGPCVLPDWIRMCILRKYHFWLKVWRINAFIL